MAVVRNLQRERVENIVGVIIFIACIATLVICQRSVSWLNLGLMLGALLMLVGLLALYNRRFQ